MLLALDIGNSRIKWGLFDGLRCRTMGFIPTRDFQDLDPVGYEFELGGAGAGLPGIAAQDGALLDSAPAPAVLDAALLAQADSLAVCSVGGSGVEARLMVHLHALGLAPLSAFRIAAAAQGLGVHNAYAEPERLGADRWAALVAAYLRGPVPAVIVMAGTATTVDALDADGHFQGGYILPGLRLMPKSLYERTAGIRPGDGTWSAFPHSTADAVASGVLAASAGAVAGMVQTLQAHSGGTAVHTLVSGGNGPALLARMRELGLAPRYERDLVLHGVAALYHAR